MRSLPDASIGSAPAALPIFAEHASVGSLDDDDVGDSLRYPAFSPIVYSVDSILPIVSLGQKERWAPHEHRGHMVKVPPWLPL